MMFYLIDLERSTNTGVMHYWKSNAHGYTIDIEEAGLYTEEAAKKHCGEDILGTTVAIKKDLVRA